MQTGARFKGEREEIEAAKCKIGAGEKHA